MLIRKVIILILATTLTGQAQFSKSLEISSSYDDNLFRSPEADDDVLTDILLNLSYIPEESDLNFKYSGNFFLYQDNNVRNFSLHEIGFNYAVPFAGDSHNLYLGADYTLRVNGDDYNYYDYNQFYAYANIRLDLGALFLTTGYNYRYRSYANLPDLTNEQHYIFAQINKSFETRTTFIIETDLGYKSFAGERTYSSTMMSGGGGRGRGSHSSSTTMSTATSSSTIPSLSQAVLLARVSQSLHEKVGIYLQYRQQFSLTDETNYINADGYYQDEEIFDDPFSYESQGYSSQLTWILPWSMQVRLGGALVSKDYVSEQAFISELDTVAAGGIRQDDRNSFYLNISKILFLNKSWLESLHFNIQYNYIRSESNSYWYNYRNNIIGGSIQWNF